jgi:DNA-binding CsgD family transcriptional regulator
VLTIGREHAGTTGRAIEAMTALSLDDLIEGSWEESLRLSGEALRLCELHGYPELRWPLWFTRAVVAASRGEATRAAGLAEQIDTWSATRSTSGVHLYGHYVRGLCAEAEGGFEAGFRQLAVLAMPAVFGVAGPLAAWACLDFVECALRTGRAGEAARFIDLLDVAEHDCPRSALLVAAARALTAPLECGAVEVALAAIGADRMPFDVARVKLAHAERLRRNRSVIEARTHLGEALALFEQLGAEPWIQRTIREIRATGAPTTVAIARPAAQPLTPQELQIAELAAAGLTNKQIAARVYLSHRTVGAHLYRVFPKLGITTRAALRDALAASRRAPLETASA